MPNRSQHERRSRHSDGRSNRSPTVCLTDKLKPSLTRTQGARRSNPENANFRELRAIGKRGQRFELACHVARYAFERFVFRIENLEDRIHHRDFKHEFGFRVDVANSEAAVHFVGVAHSRDEGR